MYTQLYKLYNIRTYSIAMKILAVDWGERRLGFAVSDETGRIAFPLSIVSCMGEKERTKAVLGKLTETGAETLVVGLPLTMQGKEGESAAAVRAFIRALEKSCAVPIVPWDERMTTDIAERASREKRGGKRGKRHERVDSLAACVLLQGYLDFLGNPGM